MLGSERLVRFQGSGGVREPSLPKELPRCLRAARRRAGGAAGASPFPRGSCHRMGVAGPQWGR